jgi:hypothetical protein
VLLGRPERGSVVSVVIVITHEAVIFVRRVPVAACRGVAFIVIIIA